MDSKQSNLMREDIMRLLTDEEVARVSTAEAGSRLAPGTEYIDLEQVDRGVQRVGEMKPASLSSALPRASVGPQTWDRIVEMLKR